MIRGHGAIRRLLDVQKADSARRKVLALLRLDVQLRTHQAHVLQRLLLGRAFADGAPSQRVGDRRDGATVTRQVAGEISTPRIRRTVMDYWRAPVLDRTFVIIA
jgi:hypothetical protein